MRSFFTRISSASTAASSSLSFKSMAATSASKTQQHTYYHSWWSSARRRAAGAMAFGLSIPVAVGCLSCVAFADSKDVSSLSRFQAFASITNDAGERFMSPDDFVRSLSVLKGCHSNTESGFLSKLFKRVDTDGDGVLNYEEFCMFYVLITNSERDFRLAFDMFDTESAGKMDVHGFKEMMRSLVADPSVRINFNGGLTELLFGTKLDKRVTFATLLEFVREIRSDVWSHEFEQLDRDSKGKITIGQLREFIFGTSEARGDLVDTNIANQVVTLSTYKTFNEIVLQSGDVIHAMKLLRDGGLECTKRDFTRALKLTGVRLSRGDIDSIFALFDLDGNGTMDVEEFEEVITRRMNFSAITVDRSQPIRGLAQELFRCMQQRDD